MTEREKAKEYLAGEAALVARGSFSPLISFATCGGCDIQPSKARFEAVNQVLFDSRF